MTAQLVIATIAGTTLLGGLFLEFMPRLAGISDTHWLNVFALCAFNMSIGFFVSFIVIRFYGRRDAIRPAGMAAPKGGS